MGLRDTWFYVRRVRTSRAGGAEARTLRGARPLITLHGTVEGASPRFVTLQHHTEDGWKDDGEFPLEDGAYSIHVGTPGIYRVMAGWAPGPELLVQPPATG
jgi:hypothetical protein